MRQQRRSSSDDGGVGGVGGSPAKAPFALLERNWRRVASTHTLQVRGVARSSLHSYPKAPDSAEQVLERCRTKPPAAFTFGQHASPACLSGPPSSRTCWMQTSLARRHRSRASSCWPWGALLLLLPPASSCTGMVACVGGASATFPRAGQLGPGRCVCSMPCRHLCVLQGAADHRRAGRPGAGRIFFRGKAVLLHGCMAAMLLGRLDRCCATRWRRSPSLSLWSQPRRWPRCCRRYPTRGWRRFSRTAIIGCALLETPPMPAVGRGRHGVAGGGAAWQSRAGERCYGNLAVAAVLRHRLGWCEPGPTAVPLRLPAPPTLCSCWCRSRCQ